MNTELMNERLLERGFSNKDLMNNRGLIGAVIEETIDILVKDLKDRSNNQKY